MKRSMKSEKYGADVSKRHRKWKPIELNSLSHYVDPHRRHIISRNMFISNRNTHTDMHIHTCLSRKRNIQTFYAWIREKIAILDQMPGILKQWCHPKSNNFHHKLFSSSSRLLINLNLNFLRMWSDTLSIGVSLVLQVSGSGHTCNM